MDAETQIKAKAKADAIVTLLGYADWLPNPAELDKYYEGVSNNKKANIFYGTTII